MRAAVTLRINAPRREVWALVSDITKMGEYSPEVMEAEWLNGASGPKLGARYRGHVRRNEKWPIYWTTCEITDCVPDEVFEFAVMVGTRRVNTWRYVFSEVDEGATDVTESSIWVTVSSPNSGARSAVSPVSVVIGETCCAPWNE
jgi:uncharacterized protein YndB with AHSA1/START domain